jgi:hypothetical protein
MLFSCLDLSIPTKWKCAHRSHNIWAVCVEAKPPKSLVRAFLIHNWMDEAARGAEPAWLDPTLLLLRTSQRQRMLTSLKIIIIEL